MTAILASTVRQFDTLADAHVAAAAAHDADAVAGRVYLASLPFGYAGIRADGCADLLETGIRGGQSVVFA